MYAKYSSIVVYTSAIELPGRVLEGDEWKYETDENKITLPLLVCVQCLYSDFDERQETTIESTLLDAMQHVKVEGKNITVYKQLENEQYEYLIRYTLTDEQAEDFIPLWEKQKVVCIEFRMYTGTFFQMVNKEDPKDLLFALGGVWDGESESWVFEPSSKPREIWC